MLRFGGRNQEGRRVIGMVLSRENVERLKGGEPVYFDGASVGVDDVIVILHVTDTPQDDLRDLMNETRAYGGKVLSLEKALEDRAAVRAAGGDPDAEPTN